MTYRIRYKAARGLDLVVVAEHWSLVQLLNLIKNEMPEQSIEHLEFYKFTGPNEKTKLNYVQDLYRSLELYAEKYKVELQDLIDLEIAIIKLVDENQSPVLSDGNVIRGKLAYSIQGYVRKLPFELLQILMEDLQVPFTVVMVKGFAVGILQIRGKVLFLTKEL